MTRGGMLIDRDRGAPVTGHSHVDRMADDVRPWQEIGHGASNPLNQKDNHTDGKRGDPMVRTGVRAQSARTLRLEDGAAGANVIVLVIVVAVVGIATLLLNETMQTAEDINDKAGTIAESGKGINTATDSIVQLNQTNDTAGSILNTAQPLEGKLNEIVNLAGSVDGLASSILNTAGAINSTAGSINATAGGINSTATGILSVARAINEDVQIINERVDVTIGLAQAIKSDTGNILGQAQDAHHHAACIGALLGGLTHHC